MPPAPTYRAVVFDFFGTLTHAVRRGPYHATIALDLGCDPAEFIRVLNETFFDRASGVYGGAEATLRRLCDMLGAAPSQAAVRKACAARVVAVLGDTRLRAEAVPVLRALRRRGIRTAVVSDCGYELPAFMPFLPVARWLDAAVYSVDVGACKPHPAMYRTACDRLGVRPEECLYVGDGGSQELTGARRAGMHVVRLDAPDLAGHLAFNAERDWTGPAVGSLTELVTFLPARRNLRTCLRTSTLVGWASRWHARQSQRSLLRRARC